MGLCPVPGGVTARRFPGPDRCRSSRSHRPTAPSRWERRWPRLRSLAMAELPKSMDQWMVNGWLMDGQWLMVRIGFES